MADTSDDSPGWERKILEKVALAAVAEQRRARRWGIFFKSVTLLYLFLVFFAAAGWFARNEMGTGGKHTALVELKGVIDAEGNASADKINASLQEAFKDKNTVGVILRINSPGGSPVQAGYINDEIHRLRARYPAIPLYVVVQDICASGGYYIAAAADRIYVDKASLVGSVGVIMDGFGFTGAMEKLGVERRALHAGENKAFLDPFSPSNPGQVAYAQKLLDQIHQQFIKVVRDGRGKRLKETPDTFSGLVWTGEESIRQGLADATGSMEYVAREVIKADDIVDFTVQENLAERLAKRIGAGAARAAAAMLLEPRISAH